ncbi:FkbM family methyltransferase [Microcystis sp. M179S2]|uniref:FkbM family methyltransferase n=1 Tax=Microcystis sp. M179S2 TaxID=2771160 RepID=UPI002583AE79|nr:FkbM family methyltransferase [Microcystis sp. M179S2]
MTHNNNRLKENYQKMLDDLDPQVLQLDRQVFKRLQNLGYSPRVIFDVGASNSGWSYYIKQVLQEAEFYLFEPLIDYSNDYRELISEILRVYPSFHRYKYALGETCGEVTMNVSTDVVSSSLLQTGDDSQPTTPISVQMLTIDEAIVRLGLPHPQVIKIDTQGSELSILKGAVKTLPKVDVLFLECWLYRGYGKKTPHIEKVYGLSQLFC